MSPHKNRKRDSELSPNMEDYLETIYLQDLEGSVAKVKNIADAMGVSKPSVTEALSVLQDRGLVTHQKYGDIELTDRGRATASQIYFRHKLFKGLMQDVLAIPEEIAEEDACKIEHIISDTTVQHVLAFVKFLEQEVKRGSALGELVPEFHRQLSARHSGDHGISDA